MPRRSSNQKDPQQLARHVLDSVVPDAEPPKKARKKTKNPAAVAPHEAREIEAVSNHCYRVYFRTCNREAWRFRGEFHNRQAAYRTAHHLREHGFEVVVR